MKTYDNPSNPPKPPNEMTNLLLKKDFGMEGQGGMAEIAGGSQERVDAMSFTDIEDRLVEALLTCWRHPDRERGWQRLRSAWPEISRDVLAGDYDARGGDSTSSDVALRPASLTRRELGEMEEAFGWLDALAPDDRKLVGLAISELARGNREVSWAKLKQRMGLKHGSDGLRMRYGRAIAEIASAQSRRNPRADASRG